MSYSFNFTAANRSEAKQKASTEMDRVVQQQPIHSNDQAQAKAAVESFIDIVPEPADGQQIAVSVSGSVSWRGGTDVAEIGGAGVQISVGTVSARK